MPSLLNWFIALPAWECVTFIVGLLAAYFAVKAIAAMGLKTSKTREFILKILYFVRILSEVLLTTIAIWASVINYQLTHILFSSLLIALVLPFLILLNHRIEDQIRYEEGHL